MADDETPALMNPSMIETDTMHALVATNSSQKCVKRFARVGFLLRKRYRTIGL